MCFVPAMVGALDKQWAADDGQQKAAMLEEIDKKLATNSDVLQASLAALGAKMSQAAALAESIAPRA